MDCPYTLHKQIYMCTWHIKGALATMLHDILLAIQSTLLLGYLFIYCILQMHDGYKYATTNIYFMPLLITKVIVWVTVNVLLPRD